MQYLSWAILQFKVYAAALMLATFLDALSAARLRRTNRAPLCSPGCLSCSDVNGCVTCEKDLFIILRREGMRQQGFCEHVCPTGYYGKRTTVRNTCHRCRVRHCKDCFRATYCSKCQAPYIQHEGQCLDRCPTGYHYANYTKECKTKVDCALGMWSSWSLCLRGGKQCGYKYGNRTRERLVLQTSSVNGEACPALTQNQTCRLKQRHCSSQPNKNSSETCLKSKCRKKGRHRRRRCRKGRRKGKKCRRRSRGRRPGRQRKRPDRIRSGSKRRTRKKKKSTRSRIRSEPSLSRNTFSR